MSKPMITHRLPGTTCPSCNATLDAATNITGESRPDPGDMTICAKCGTILIFEAWDMLRPAVDDEILDLPQRVRLALFHAQARIRGRR